MAQSEIQTLIQKLAGVQTGAQANSQNSANSGNPNTVYNTEGWGYGGPPVSNAQGEWSMNNFSDAADTTLGSWQPPGGWGSTGNGTGPVLPLGVMPINNGWTPAPVPGTTPPPGGGSNVGTGGPGDGNVSPGVFGPGRPTGGVVGPQLPGTSFNNYTQSSGGNGPGGVNWSGGIQGILSSIGQSLGMKPGGGGMDWQQALDLFLPGDLYNSETGRWNAGNSLITAANAVSPVLGALVQLAINQGWGPAVLRQRIIDDGLAQANADLRGTVTDLTTQTRNLMENRTNQTLNDRALQSGNAFMPGGVGWRGLIGTGNSGTLGSSPFDSEYNGNILDRMGGWTGAPTRDGRSGTSTGSGVVWSAENGGNFAGGNESMYLAELDALKNIRPGIPTSRIK